MKNVKLIVDSSSNSFSDPERNLTVVPLTISFGGKEYVDNEDLELEDYLKKMDENNIAGRTSCPSLQDWLQVLDGVDKAIILTMTSQMSGTYSSALQARNIYLEKHPKAEIIVVDSRSAGPELELVIQGIEQLLNSKIRFVDLDEAIAKMRMQTHLLFVLQSLHNLSLNGRVSPAIAKVTKMLKINITGTASKEGKLEQLSKSRGMKKSLRELIKQMKERGFKGGNVIIDYCENHKDAEKLKVEILAEYPNAKIELRPMRGLCSFYAEKGGLMVAFDEK